MRLWSIHPKYLDRQGLVALWREALLAQKVLAGKTKGYTQHPQLLRFKQSPNAQAFMSAYLHFVAEEALSRRYAFDRSKIFKISRPRSFIRVTRGQLAYERQHLLKKLKQRDPLLYQKLHRKKRFDVHPIFSAVSGGVEHWERV